MRIAKGACTNRAIQLDPFQFTRMGVLKVDDWRPAVVVNTDADFDITAVVGRERVNSRGESGAV